jgi:transcriptional regulator with XRE-family HTH domain
MAGAMGVSVARVSQIEHGEVASFEVIARYVEALGGRFDGLPLRGQFSPAVDARSSRSESSSRAAGRVFKIT